MSEVQYDYTVKVFIFLGFDLDSNGEPLMNSPVWQESTAFLRSQLRNNGVKKVFCKLVRYEENAQVDENLELPVYNEYLFMEL